MKNNIKRLFALLLAVALVFCVAGCQSGGRTTTSTITTTEEFTEGSAVGGSSTTVVGGNSGSSSGKNNLTSSQAQKLEQAKKELEGYTFTIASGWIKLENDLNENTPLMDRLLWEQIKKVEKDLGCDIKVTRFYARNNEMRPYIMAGKKVADLVETMPIWIPQNVNDGSYKSWEDVPGIDLSDTNKWLPSSIKNGVYNGKKYGIQFIKPAEARFCVMFNKTLLEKEGIKADTLYKLVKDKKWTWDKMREFALKVTKDNNSDGINDNWGILGKYDYIANAILPSFGGRLIAKNKDGKYVYNLNSASSLAALNYYDKLVNTDKCVWVADQLLAGAAPNEQTYVQKFNAGNGAFLIWESWVLNQYTALNANFEYGILPLPLGGSQKNYVTPAHNEKTFCVTSTNKDLDKAVVVINALADGFGGYKGDDWYEDVAADYFKNDVEKNVEMYKLIIDSNMIDYGLTIEGLEAHYYSLIQNSIYTKTTTPAAAVDSIKNTYTDAINSVFNKK